MPNIDEKILYFNTITSFVRRNGYVTIEPYCNAYEVVNIGTIVATVNGCPLSPPAVGETLGDSFTDGGWKGEIFLGKVNIQFAAAVGGIVLLKQKIYLPEQDRGLQL